MSTTVEELQRAIDNVHRALVICTDTIIECLSAKGETHTESHRWVEYANQLERLVPDYAVPVWLKDACVSFGGRYDYNHNKAMAIFVTTRAPEIKQPILVGEAASLNVEELFSEQAEKANLEQLFESLVAKLSELIALDVIENRLVHEALTRLHALFRRNKRGSFAAVC